MEKVFTAANHILSKSKIYSSWQVKPYDIERVQRIGRRSKSNGISGQKTRPMQIICPFKEEKYEEFI